MVVEGNGSIDQIGRVAVWGGEIEPCLHQNHLIKARLLPCVHPRFALHFFLSKQGRNLIVNEASFYIRLAHTQPTQSGKPFNANTFLC